MKNMIRALTLSMLAVLMVACSSGGPSLKENLMTGQWEGEVQGFPVTLKYNETEIEVVGMGMTMPYTLEGSTLSFDVPGQGPMEFEVSIDGDTLTQSQGDQVSTLTRKM